MTVGDDQFCNLQFYRVAQPRALLGRFEVAAAAGSLTPLVGREGELLDGDFATGAADSSDLRMTICNTGPGTNSEVSSARMSGTRASCDGCEPATLLTIFLSFVPGKSLRATISGM